LGTVYNRGSPAKPNWWFRWIEPGGRRRYQKVGPDKALAKRLLAKVESDILAGRYDVATGREAPPAPPRFDVAILAWVEARRLTHRAARADIGRAKNHLAPFFRGARLDEIGPKDMKRFIAQKRGALRPQTIINCLNLVSRFYNDRIEDGEDLRNPVARLDRATRRAIGPRYDPKKTPFLREKKDIRAVYLALPVLAPDQPFRAMFAVGAFGGLRTDEILGLPKANVDLARRVITVDCTAKGPVKDDELRTVPINDTLLPILREWASLAPAGDMLFPPTSGRGKHVRPHTLHKHLKLALEECKLRALTWYQATRHTFASHYVQDGGSIEKLAMILGHDSITTTQRYAHLSPDRFDQRDYATACVDLSEPTSAKPIEPAVVEATEHVAEPAPGYAGVTIAGSEDEGQKGPSKKGVSRRHVATHLPA